MAIALLDHETMLFHARYKGGSSILSSFDPFRSIDQRLLFVPQTCSDPTSPFLYRAAKPDCCHYRQSVQAVTIEMAARTH